MLHIGEFIYQHNRSARAIDDHSHMLSRDWYSDNIRQSAAIMVDLGKSDWVYVSQDPNGYCEWECPTNDTPPDGIDTIIIQS